MSERGTYPTSKCDLHPGYVTYSGSRFIQTQTLYQPIRALVACHCSMVVVEELLALGVDAWSCDLKPAERESDRHIIGDAREVVRDAWDLLIASPVCRVMANSGSKHLYIGMKKENGPYLPRWEALDTAVDDFNAFAGARHIPHRLIENSIMHEHARKRVGRQTQVCQPWWFGDPFLKGMALWIYGMDPIAEDPAISLRAIVPKPGTPEHKQWSACWMAAPGPERETIRSRTHRGTARAWARHCVEQINARRSQPELFARAA